jgi:hypothetical protein
MGLRRRRMKWRDDDANAKTDERRWTYAMIG